MQWSPAPPARSSLLKVLLAICVGSVGLAGATFLGCESRIEVLGDESTVYIKAVPGDDVKYRLSEQAPFEVAATHDNFKNYIFRVPIPIDARPRRGTLPIQINYRTWFGPRRTKWVSLDVDDDQLRAFFMRMWSGGWLLVARFDGGERLRLDAPNERCIRWRYGFDGAPPALELPEGAGEIRVPASVQSVTLQPALCKRGQRICTMTFSRDGSDPKRTCD